jgi:hypothetical protein
MFSILFKIILMIIFLITKFKLKFYKFLIPLFMFHKFSHFMILNLNNML